MGLEVVISDEKTKANNESVVVVVIAVVLVLLVQYLSATGLHC